MEKFLRINFIEVSMILAYYSTVQLDYETN